MSSIFAMPSLTTLLTRIFLGGFSIPLFQSSSLRWLPILTLSALVCVFMKLSKSLDAYGTLFWRAFLYASRSGIVYIFSSAIFETPYELNLHSSAPPVLLCGADAPCSRPLQGELLYVRPSRGALLPCCN